MEYLDMFPCIESVKKIKCKIAFVTSCHFPPLVHFYSQAGCTVEGSLVCTLAKHLVVGSWKLTGTQHRCGLTERLAWPTLVSSFTNSGSTNTVLTSKTFSNKSECILPLLLSVVTVKCLWEGQSGKT